MVFQFRNILSGLILLLALPLGLFSQNCAQKIQQAEELMSLGKFRELTDLFAGSDSLNCSNPKNKDLAKSDRIRIQRMLTIAYLYQDRQEEAEASYLRLLRLEPEHHVDEEGDPAELIELSRQFVSRPLMSIGIRSGINVSFAIPFNTGYGADNGNAGKARYSYLTGFDIGLHLDFPLSDKWGIMAEVFYSQKGYDFENELQFSGEPFSVLTFTEKQTWLQIPMLLRLDLNVKKQKEKGDKWAPFLYGGVSVDRLIEANLSGITRKDLQDDSNIVGGENESISVTSQRNPWNFSLVAGGGFRYKIGRGYLLMDLRASAMVSNVVNPNTRYDNDRLLMEFGHVDEDYSIGTVYLGLGYALNIYYARKK